ncbi:MAG TPA: diaminopimelate epimerase [Candidatus Avamphibacillus sp.]|nr:diaminopimelate epimerase [Candidatus Avamphibacillus sp.]
MEIPFTKMHGLGNNYIYFNLIEFDIAETLLPELAMEVSNVHTGIGSDGMILIQPSDTADLGMRIFNKDGSEGMNCGNGLRCTAKYAYEQGIIDSEYFRIETKARIVEVSLTVVEEIVQEITISMGDPLLNRYEVPMLGEDNNHVISEPFWLGEDCLKLTALSMGNPHAVFIVDDIKEAPLYELGPIIEKDSRFPDRVNVEFIEIVSATEINFRVWERGSGVTEACGTGACAAVVAAVLNDYAKRNEAIVVHLQGGDLVIKWDHDGVVWMTGSAHMIATGTFYTN